MTTQHPEGHSEHHSVRDEIHHLEDVAERGESGETPFILIGRVGLFVLPVAVVLLGLALAAYYLF